jgi:hypothetical protein
MGNYIDEQFEILDELIRLSCKSLNPYNPNDFSWLKNKSFLEKMLKEKPDCFIISKSKSIPFLCVCNQMGIHDLNMIQYTKKILDNPEYNSKLDSDELISIQKRLDFFKRKYDKKIPKPIRSAIRKSRDTRKLNRIKNYIRQISSKKN